MMNDKQNKLAQTIVAQAAKYIGIVYRYGAEPPMKPEPPKALDCSEMIERVFKLVPGAPVLPDGARFQAVSKNVKRASVAEAMKVPAALVFCATKDGHVHHVGLTTGDGRVIEANGGIGRVVRRKPREGYWQFGAFVDGIHY